MKLSIIIINWNTKELIDQCLASLKQSRVTDTEVIVVDNGSTDGSKEEIQNSKIRYQNQNLKLKTIFNKENLGFAQANNQGLKQAQGDYVMLLNSDTVVRPKALEKLVDFLDTNLEWDIVGPRLLNRDGSYQPSCGRFPRPGVVLVMLFLEHFGGSSYVRSSPAEAMPVDWLMGAALVARKRVFDRVGGLDEGFFMYMEEVDWFYRAAKAGFKAYFFPKAEIVHLWQGSSTSGKKGPILNIYQGLIRFYRKHYSPAAGWLLLILLKLKALFALALGYLKSDSYLKETYGQAIKIH